MIRYMHWIIIILGFIFAGCNTNTYDYKEDTSFTAKRMENKEVVCYQSGHGLWCYKKIRSVNDYKKAYDRKAYREEE